MDDATRTFERLRPRLLSIAYRMLGSTTEAEVVVQDAYLRWREAAPATLDKAETSLDGQWGLLFLIDGAMESAQSYEIDGKRIVRIHVQRNLTI